MPSHNHALRGTVEPFVCVLNPDVELLAAQEPFAALVRTASERAWAALIRCSWTRWGACRIASVRRHRRWPFGVAACCVSRREVDWVNAACLVLPLPAWQAVRGFDESYFMYCEDVDLCLRLRLGGLRLQRAPARVVHAGQRASGRHWRHLIWRIAPTCCGCGARMSIAGPGGCPLHPGAGFLLD